MQRISWILVFSFLATACGDETEDTTPVDTPDLDFPDSEEPAEDMGIPDGPRFKVVTFNTQRFFDTVCQSNNCGANSFEDQKSQAEFDFKLSQVVSSIEEMNADAVLLQEIENETVMDAIQGALEVPFDVAVIGEIGTSASLDVVVLSRGELIETRTHRENPIYRPDGSRTSFAREFLEVHVDVDGERVVLFSTHFRSQRDDDPGRRIAEAEAGRTIVKGTAAEFPDALVVWGGDLNDTPDSETLSSVVSDPALNLLTETDFWSYQFNSQRQHIDHLILAENGGGAYDEGTLEQFLEAGGGFGGSDHAAVGATFLMVD